MTFCTSWKGKRMPKLQPRGGYTLKNSPFFRLRSRKKLAKLLRVSVGKLASITGSDQLYIRRWKHKELDCWRKTEPKEVTASDFRPIDIPDYHLKIMQARIATLLSRIEPPSFLFSPVKGRSYVDNAAHHVGAKAYWMLDVANYFPSCTANNVAHFFRCDLECSPDVTALLVRLTTLNEYLPQGSPCSPILAYFSNRKMWEEIANVVQKENCRVSVYADDITISGDKVPKVMIWKIKKIIHNHGLRLKPSKEISLISAPADITGVIVRNGKTKLPNRQLKKLAQLKVERAKIRNPTLRKMLDSKIAGRQSQRSQVERY